MSTECDLTEFCREIMRVITKDIADRCEAPVDYTFLEKAAYVKGLEDACGSIGRCLARVRDEVGCD